MNIFKALTLFIVLSSLLYGCQSTPEAEPSWLEYRCDKEQSIKVAYFLSDADGGYIRVSRGEDSYKLDNVVTGSGIKYSDETYTWWSQGKVGVFMINDTVLLKNCVATNQ
jgi:membrane-bound inhibitor of C-type lysozyme